MSIFLAATGTRGPAVSRGMPKGSLPLLGSVRLYVVVFRPQL